MIIVGGLLGVGGWLVYDQLFAGNEEAPAPEVARAEPAPAPVPVDAAGPDPVWWRENLPQFVKGKGVKDAKITGLDGMRIRIETKKCDEAKLGVEQLGALPKGFRVECASKKGVEWTLSEEW